MTKDAWKEQLTTEGFTDLTECTIGPASDLGAHTHNEHTVHVILDGSLIVIDGPDEDVLAVGDRTEFPAGTTHRAVTGPTGVTMLVGVRRAHVEGK